MLSSFALSGIFRTALSQISNCEPDLHWKTARPAFVRQFLMQLASQPAGWQLCRRLFRAAIEDKVIHCV